MLLLKKHFHHEGARIKFSTVPAGSVPTTPHSFVCMGVYSWFNLLLQSIKPDDQNA